MLVDFYISVLIKGYKTPFLFFQDLIFQVKKLFPLWY